MLFYALLSILCFIFLSLSGGLSPVTSLLLTLWLLLLIKLSSVSSHVLLVLLLLEFFMLLFLTLLMSLKNNLFSNSNFILTFFTLAVCEASLGLGLLISLSRKFGTQTLSSFLSFKLIKLLAFKASTTLGKA